MGESGCGKSTLLKLLLRFWERSGGQIRYNGTDLDEINTESLYRNVTMVSQSTYLFDATIAENLRIAKPDATDEELMAALRMASAEELVQALPEGLSTRPGCWADGCPWASGSASGWRGRFSPAARLSCWTSRRATWTASTRA